MGYNLFIEFYRVLLGFTWVVLGFLGFFLVSLDYHRSDSVSIKFYRVSTGFYRVLLVLTGFNRVLLGFTWFRKLYQRGWMTFSAVEPMFTGFFFSAQALMTTRRWIFYHFSKPKFRFFKKKKSISGRLPVGSLGARTDRKDVPLKMQMKCPVLICIFLSLSLSLSLARLGQWNASNWVSRPARSGSSIC